MTHLLTHSPSLYLSLPSPPNFLLPIALSHSPLFSISISPSPHSLPILNPPSIPRLSSHSPFPFFQQTLTRASNGAAEVTKVKTSGQADLLGIMTGDRLIGKEYAEEGEEGEGGVKG